MFYVYILACISITEADLAPISTNRAGDNLGKKHALKMLYLHVVQGGNFTLSETCDAERAC
jgi:hypothetical protein